ncbi:MAG: hypothetical protein ACLSA6_10790 [Holdemania massiliensis]
MGDSCLLESHFSSLNPDYQKWLDNEVINDYFGYEIDLGKDYAMMMFTMKRKMPRPLRSLSRSN